MKTMNHILPIKFLSSIGFAVGLMACSGHGIGDPTEKYGDIQKLAKDGELKEFKEPSYMAHVPIDVTGNFTFEEGRKSELTVKVRVPLDESYDLRVSAPNEPNVNLVTERISQEGNQTEWKVTWDVPSSFVPSEEHVREVLLEFAVHFANYSGNLPKNVERITVVRRSITAVLQNISIESSLIVGLKVPFTVEVDPRGTTLSSPPRLFGEIIVNDCDPLQSACTLEPSRLIFSDFENVDGQFISNSFLNLEGIDLQDKDQMQLTLNFTLESPGTGRTSKRSESITVRAPIELQAPVIEVSLQNSSDTSIQQGQNIDVGLIVTQKGSRGELSVDEDFFTANLESDMAGLSLNCDSVVNGEISCAVSGGTSCETVAGQRTIKVRAENRDGENVETTDFDLSITMSPKETCE